MATAALIIAVLAILVGLVTVALAAAPTRPARGHGSDGLGSRRGLGSLCLIAGGCLLVTGGQCLLFRHSAMAPAVRSEAQGRLQVALLEPLEALTIRLHGPDPFHARGQSGAGVLRLRLNSVTGSTLTSEVPASRLLPAHPASADWYEHEYIVPWPSVIDSATTEEGRSEAGRIRQLNDLRRFGRVDAAILARTETAGVMPGRLRIVSRTEHPVQLFKGVRASRRKEDNGDRTVWSYDDEESYISFKDRLTGWKAMEPYWTSQRGSNAVLVGLLGAGVVLLVVGLGQSPRGDWAALWRLAAPPRLPPWLAPAFVWGVWAMMLVASSTFVWKFAHNMPDWDDWWVLVPYVTSQRPVTASYLWQQDVEHRYPLTKAIGIGLIKLAGGDFRAIAVFKIVALGCMSCVLILLARRLRGWTSLTDAFLPLALLQFGFPIPICAAWASLAYFTPTVIATPLLMIAVYQGTRLTFGSAMLAGFFLALLPLCSATGVLYLPFLTLWLACSGIQSWRSPAPGGKQVTLAIVGGIGAAVIITALYFTGYEREVAFAPARPGLLGLAMTCLAFLAGTCGEATWFSWPYSGLLMLAWVLLTTGVLVRAAWRHDGGPDRSRAIGTLFALGSIGMLSLGIAWGRSGFGYQMGFQYPLMALPILWCTYFAWGLHRPRLVAQFAQAFLLLIAGMSAAVNLPARIAKGQAEHETRQAFESDIVDGKPLYMIVSPKYLVPAAHGTGMPARIVGNGALDGMGAFDKGAEYIRMLQRAGNGVFRPAAEDPSLRALVVPLDPIEFGEVDWEEGTGRATSSKSFLMFRLPRPMYVAAIRIRCKTSQEDRAVSFTLSWKGLRDPDFPQPQFATSTFPAEPLTVAVAGTIDQIRVYPNRSMVPDSRPFDFQIMSLEVLLPSD